MKRHRNAGLCVLLVAFAMGSSARAQEVSESPQGVIRLQREPYFNSWAPGQRGGGAGRGFPVWTNRELGPKKTQIGGAWWTNTALVQQLGLTDDQKAKIERTFENHRQSIVSSTALLEKEEAQLGRLLEAEPLDRSAVLTQIDRVVQARGEIERANAAMTMEMREILTRAQWMQLQGSPQTRVRVGANVTGANLISQVPPVYPEVAKQARIQGVVVLEVEITKEGSVDNVRVLSGHPLLTQPALDAVKQWRYKPTLLNNEPVPVVTTVMVNFPFLDGNGERGAGPVPSPSGTGQRRARGQQ
jgi:TonB family protein